MGRSLTILGVCLLSIGAVLLIGPTFGFGTLAADRGVQVAVADDPDAYLGVIDNSGSAEADVVPSNGGVGTLFYLDDNADTFGISDVSADVVAFEGGSADDLDATVVEADEHDFSVEVTCDSNVNTRGVSVTVAIVASGDATIELDRESGPIDVQCRSSSGPVGFQNVNAGNVMGPAPATQEFTFTLDQQIGKNEPVEISFTGTRADYDNAEIDEFTVGGKTTNDNIEFDGNGNSGTITVTPQGNIKGGEEVRISLGNIGIESGWLNFGFASFSSGTSNELDFFSVESGGSFTMSATGSTSPETSSTDDPITVTRSDLEQVSVDDLEHVDDLDELAEWIEQEDGIELVGERE